MTGAELIQTQPGDDEIAAGFHRDCGREAVHGGGRVHTKLVPQRRARGVELPHVDPPAIGTVPLPRDGEVAVRVHRQRRANLLTGRVRVDLNLRALRPVKLSREQHPPLQRFDGVA